MPGLILAAPLSGWIMDLADVPDPAFAERMVGEGVAIDPTDAVLCAPCDGEIAMVAEARHAVTLRAATGAEILLHVGLDTVALQGAGFSARVAAGRRVRQGEPLLDLDLDRLARHARSLITPVVVTNARHFPVSGRIGGRLIAAGEPIFEIGEAADERDESQTASGPPDAAAEVIVGFEHGFHARPAARIARLAQQYDARVTLAVRGQEADARSTVALMAMGVARGDPVELRGFGAGAEGAVRALAEAISAGHGESAPRVPAPARRVAVPDGDVTCRSQSNARRLRGTVASPGLAIGVAAVLEQPRLEVAETGAGPEFERAALASAREAVRTRLLALAGQTGNDILEAQAGFLDDPGLLDDAHAAIGEGKSAGYAWRNAIRRAEQPLRALGDSRQAERVADLRDIELQVLRQLANGDDDAAVALPDAAILLATELLPSELSRLDLRKVAGFCSAVGGATSHVALLAAARGIPALVGAGAEVLKIAAGTRLLLDAVQGTLQIEPDERALAEAEVAIAERRTKKARFLRDAAAPCRTVDGERIEVLANLAAVAEAAAAVASGAEGCGLLRTEFLFQDRASAPTEDEQAADYQAIADALEGRPLVIRTLDAGGDKPIAYLPLPREENPLLGLRGLRVSFRFPDLLRAQLAALLRVEPTPRILLPMITEPREIRRVREMVEAIADGRQLTSRIAIGAMIETPASVALAPAIARAADFLSIGSNDLAQYTLAIDRTHPDLAGDFDFFHPAVVRQIDAVCKAAAPLGRSVSVCGALASELAAAPVLLGLGVATLSAVPGIIPELKALIRQLSMESCRRLARAALETEDAPSLRRLAEEFAAARGGGPAA